MATAVVREVIKESLRSSSKYMACFANGKCIFATDRCSRGVFSCASLDCPQNLLCSPRKPLVRRHQLGAMKLSVADHHDAMCMTRITHQDCWKCGTSIDPNKEQYFCSCGVVQPPLPQRSFFQVMELEEKFDVDVKLLAEKYRDLQRILHPDKYSQKSQTEKDFSDQHSSLVNKAYNVILKPLTRGLYLLQLNEEDLEKESQTDIEFLDKIIEINEAILEADSIEVIQTLETKNLEVFDRLVTDISQAFRNNDQELAKKLLLQLKYYTNIAEKIKDVKMHYSE